MPMPLTYSSAGRAIDLSKRWFTYLEAKVSVPHKELAGRTGAERFECSGDDFILGVLHAPACVLRVKKVSIKAATALCKWSQATQLDIPIRSDDKPHVHVVIYLEVRMKIDLHAQFCDLKLIAYRLMVLACVTQ